MLSLLPLLFCSTGSYVVFGWIRVSAEATRLSGEEHSLLRNAAMMVAIILENRFQEERERERLRIEERRRSDREFRAVLEKVHLYAVMLDTGGRILYCNDYLLK